MRVRLVAMTLAVAGVCLFAGSQLPAPAEPQQQAEAIDFDVLRAQAQAALTALQQSREARVASVAASDASSTGQESHRATGVVGQPFDRRLVKRFQLFSI
jgi:hypothetical protein